ncbi:MAG: isoprenylcysteine carboxylmethyltransferase family protein [Gammaproteobacteria bacterium]|nr:isoprenylcysteine carboxylmethyltransferase family protein [Gammaproteobacteria bacterium]MYH47703.1 isoprenylcysteine carboxylmethyltransferase family protein [Gammaproteobacteria bacterium]MYL14312.1 isoprenylcysteine carboxylmethyltransferase family protein [Gammaproteobacteria bacterium]
MFEKGTTARAILGSFAFFLAAPAIVAGIVPYALSDWSMQPPLFGLSGERIVGVVAVVVGLACLLDCFARFALEGRGTPSPIEQTEVLVVSGLYRFVRNPMYVCVVTIVAGQALILGQALVFAYAGLLMLVFHLFVRFYEEPRLRRVFEGSYETYCLHVRRWWPRLTPWRGPGSQAS